MEDNVKVNDNITLLRYKKDDCNHALVLKSMMTEREIVDRTGPLLQNVVLNEDNAFLVQINNTIVGIIDFNEYQDTCYVSYAILETERNKGYATQILVSIPSYIFSTYPNIKQVMACIEKDNTRSINSVIKAGYQLYKDNSSNYIMYQFSNEKMLETASKII